MSVAVDRPLMAGGQQGAADAETEGDPLPDNALFDLYRRFIGEPDTESDVYLGFGLFFGGIVALGLAFVLFLATGTYQPGQEGLTPGPAYALGMLAVPTVLVGVVVLLPVERRALYAALAGSAVTLVAVGAFLWAYPQRWNSTAGADVTAPIVVVYALGLTAVVASTGAALVAHAVARARPPSFEEVEELRDETDDEETWTDEEIEADIEQAMAETELSWGGVERDESRSLNLDTETVEIDASGMDVEPETTRVDGDDGVDGAVAGLRKLKGEGPETATSESTVDDQTAALNELRRKKQQGEAPEPTTDDGLLSRVRGLLD